MKKIEANDPETTSPDLVAQNIAKLKTLFPELLTEGPDGAAVNVDVLRQLVGDRAVTDADEKYGLTWHGKRAARRLALTPSTGTLRPCPEDSVDWDSTRNLMIEGDNLEVLKLLQKSYAGKVKLIYIDPPYNTGKNFVYPDNFQDNIRNYLELTGQVEGGQKISSNTEASGRFHTGWLNMMYPRLKVARDLLRPDGVICASIDDSELANLRGLCDQIFGGDNFVGRVTWERKRKGSHLSQKFVQRTESLVIYSRSGSNVRLFGEPAGEDEDQPLVKRTNATKTLTIPAGIVETSMSDGDFERGRYGDGTSSVELLSPVTIHNGRFISALEIRGPFIWTQEKLDEELSEGGRLFIRTRNFSLRALKAPHRQGFKALSSFLSRAVGTNEDALAELAALFQVPEDEVAFDYPKPLGYIQKIVSSATHWDTDAIVVDFFAGSGTTAHAVMAQNAADGGKRRYILVQLPEPLDPENKNQKVAAEFCERLKKPLTIAELTKERLRRAGAKIREENPLFAGDLGFRVFKLDSTNIREWAPSPRGGPGMRSVTVTLSLPPRALRPNARVCWQAKAAAVKRYRRNARLIALSVLERRTPPRWEEAVARPVFYWPDNRRRDRDNAAASLKAVYDGLTDAGVLDDDVGLVPMPPEMRIDRRNPRVEIQIMRGGAQQSGQTPPDAA